MNCNPAISVILPVYNAEAYVREAVESILAQTFTDFECIIINDDSTDGSRAILRELAMRDARIVLVERPNGGLVSALNKDLEMASGEWRSHRAHGCRRCGYAGAFCALARPYGSGT